MKPHFPLPMAYLITKPFFIPTCLLTSYAKLVFLENNLGSNVLRKTYLQNVVIPWCSKYLMLEQKLWSLQEKKKNHSPLLDRQKICSIGNQAISQRPRKIIVTEPEICPKEAHGTSRDTNERRLKGRSKYQNHQVEAHRQHDSNYFSCSRWFSRLLIVQRKVFLR